MSALGYGEARASAHWLLDLEVGGRVYRFADSPIEVSTDNGDTLSYREGLQPIETSSKRDGAAQQTQAISLKSGVDWALLEARGHSIERSPCTLRRWHSGLTYERARVQLEGMALDVLAPLLDSVRHQDREDLIRGDRVLRRDAVEPAPGQVHRGLP